MSLKNKSILVVITGGIAAYKTLELIRRLREQGSDVKCIMTNSAKKFITPLSVSAITANKVHTKLFEDDQSDVMHIKLARETDLVVVAPASANFIAKVANGFANDLASNVMLATEAKILIAPAMNPKMWSNNVTKKNVSALKKNGVEFVGPNKGEMAEKNEAGIGRMSEPNQIITKIKKILGDREGAMPLKGKTALVTSGPTQEKIDPVRFISNYSSGKQGHAIAQELKNNGAKVILVSGPVQVKPPDGVKVVNVVTADEMLKETKKYLPVDIAICAAAVADWKTKLQNQKIKKTKNKIPDIKFVENPDILKYIANSKKRPKLVVGFAAETQNIVENAKQKLKQKNANWIIANNATKTIGKQNNQVVIVTKNGEQKLPNLSKEETAKRIVRKICSQFE